MPRSAHRLADTAACYPVLNRRHARETIFHDEDRQTFLHLLRRDCDRYEANLYPYVLFQGRFRSPLVETEA